MPSGPLVALLFLVVALPLLGGFLFFEWRRHHKEAPKGRTAPARLPLFGTDALAPESERVSGFSPPPPIRANGTAERTGAGAAIDMPRSPASAAIATSVADGHAPDHRSLDDAPLNGRRASVEPPLRAPDFGASPLERPRITAVRAEPARAEIARAELGHPHIGRPESGALIAGETLRFSIPDDGTLQFLPGRLEVVNGPDVGRDVRFVRPLDGRAPIEITFGRSEGTPYQHVQLMARTVSRKHATMTLEDDHWSLRNLSATNPVVLNGRPLAEDELAPLLVDGDRIEMGEVVFVFHSR